MEPNALNNTTAHSKRTLLRGLLGSGRSVVVPGTHDALSAIHAQRAGFEAAYIGSYAVSASLGFPDLGLLTLDEMVRAARDISRAVTIPVIVDAEDGFSHSGGIWRTVRSFEEAGVSAIHVDDHVQGPYPQSARLAPMSDFTDRLHACVEARTDGDLVLIGRTDVALTTTDLDLIQRRVHAVASTGVDVIFAPGLDTERLEEIRKEITVPFMTGATAPYPAGKTIPGGSGIVIYPAISLLAATLHVRTLFEALRASLDVLADEGRLESPQALQRALDSGRHLSSRRP
ncbi:MAG: isocitrate lyase/PEP mutase family protein [Polaromonas sp.]|nr:isocitrate lyase/PEP mutase family protein [Polaromonas sp.]